MSENTIARHSTSFGIEACKLAMVLYILAIFRGIFFTGVIWGFWAVTLIFWLAEKDSPYFRAQAAQLTVLMAMQGVLKWLLAIPAQIAAIRWLVSYLPAQLAYIEYMDPDDIYYLVMSIFSSGSGAGVVAVIFSTLSSIVDIGAFVLLVIGAVKAGKTTDWRIPGVSSVAGWLDEKLHKGARTF